MTKRATRANAETLDAIRKQAEARGREEGERIGRQRMLDELSDLMPNMKGMGRLAEWLDAFCEGWQAGRGSPHRAALWRNDLSNALVLLGHIENHAHPF